MENPNMPGSNSPLNHIIYPSVNFDELVLTQFGFYIGLPELIAFEKDVIKPQNKHDEECFKWAVVSILSNKYC